MTFLGMPGATPGVGQLREERPFPDAAQDALGNRQLRANLANATATIRGKREGVVAELPDWPQLRAAGAAIKDDVLANLDTYLVELEVFLQLLPRSSTGERMNPAARRRAQS